jgi:hypothetical protein
MYRSLFYSIVAGVISSCRDASKKTHPVSGKIYNVQKAYKSDYFEYLDNRHTSKDLDKICLRNGYRSCSTSVNCFEIGHHVYYLAPRFMNTVTFLSFLHENKTIELLFICYN